MEAVEVYNSIVQPFADFHHPVIPYSLRVIRHLQFNARWAARLEKQRQKQQAREERKKQQAEQAAARKAEQEAKKNVDPFAMSSSTSASTGGPFGAGGFGSTNGSDSNPFGAPTSAASKSTPAVDEAPDSDEDSCTSSDEEDSINDEEERLSDELAMKAAVSSSSSSTRDAWTTTAQPSYRPSLYLSTIPESSASARAGDKAAKAQQSSSADNEEDDDDDDDDDATNGMKSFEKEGYEKMMLAGMDDVLEKFIARVGAEGRQVVRYEMGGQPLPFSAQGELYKSLWPMSGSGSSKSTKPTFDSTRIPPCQVCGSKRTFEFQLMPNLVNTLRADSIQGGADDHNNDTTTNTTVDDATTRKRRELEAVLGKSLPSLPGSDGITRTNAQDAQRLKQKTGLCWSTALVFVCEKDCCVPREKNGPEGETWREEWVGLQFEE